MMKIETIILKAIAGEMAWNQGSCVEKEKPMQKKA